MKKITVALLSLWLLLSFAACKLFAPKLPDGTVNPLDLLTEDSREPITTETVQEAVISTPLWTLHYNEALWVVEEDGLRDGADYSSVILTIPDEEDSYQINAEIRVSLEDAENFRSYLNSYGFHDRTYVEGGYDLTEIGGVGCLREESNYWGMPCLRYFNRMEGAGATILVEIIGSYRDPVVDELLSGLEFSLTDVGNVDFPWPWEGEAFSAQSHTAELGDIRLQSQWIPFADCIVTHDTFNHTLAAAGDTVCVLSDGVGSLYRFDGQQLSFQEVVTEGVFSKVQSDRSGSFWFSDFLEKPACLQDGILTEIDADTDYLAMHPSGTWGISWFNGSECSKVTFGQGTAVSEPLRFEGPDTINHLSVDENRIYVCGTDVNWDHKIFVYNLKGDLELVLNDSDGSLGSITFVAHTAKGFIALDGNMREVVLWDKDGNLLGAVKDSDLFGTAYPWFCGGAVLEDGSLLLLMTEDRADSSAMELVAFRLSGF